MITVIVKTKEKGSKILVNKLEGMIELEITILHPAIK